MTNGSEEGQEARRKVDGYTRILHTRASPAVNGEKGGEDVESRCSFASLEYEPLCFFILGVRVLRTLCSSWPHQRLSLATTDSIHWSQLDDAYEHRAVLCHDQAEAKMKRKKKSRRCCVYLKIIAVKV